MTNPPKLPGKIGATVAGVLRSRGVTQESARTFLGLSRSAMTRRIAGGGRGFTAAELYVLAACLDVPVSTLYPERLP